MRLYYLYQSKINGNAFEIIKVFGMIIVLKIAFMKRNLKINPNLFFIYPL